MTYVLPSGIIVPGIDPATVEVGPEGVVYLLHFGRPYKHARHYLGWASEGHLVARLNHHRAGTGAHLIRVIQDQNIDWHLARTWRGDRNEERRIKNRGGKTRLCPSCGVIPAALPLRTPDGRYVPQTPSPILIGAAS